MIVRYSPNPSSPKLDVTVELEGWKEHFVRFAPFEHHDAHCTEIVDALKGFVRMRREYHRHGRVYVAWWMVPAYVLYRLLWYLNLAIAAWIGETTGLHVPGDMHSWGALINRLKKRLWQETPAGRTDS